jgi:hypothetical protein
MLLGAAPCVTAAERYAVVITGASGGPQYARKYDAWRNAFVKTLTESLGYPADHVFVLAEEAAGDVKAATRENVRATLTALQARATADDVVLALLIGHGTGADEDEGKFNLVGPDLTAAEWARALDPIRARVVFVDASSGSFPFLRRLAGRNRIVITANDSPAQQYETVFPEYFIAAFAGDEADADKNGRVSIWEAFAYASDGVRRWFEERGQLATERPLLDDTGSGIGREAGADGRDGTTAQVTYLRAEPPITRTGDAELDELLRRRGDLQSQLEQLRARKASMSADDYEAALEKLLVELAQVDRRIREKSH